MTPLMKPSLEREVIKLGDLTHIRRESIQLQEAVSAWSSEVHVPAFR